MLVHLISSLAVILCTLLFTWLGFRLLGRQMPRYLLPMLGALSAIAYGIYSEYTWASRTIAQLPDHVRVVHRLNGQSPFSPWSYLVPRVDRLSVIDEHDSRTHPDHPDIQLINLILLQRFQPTRGVSQLVDCHKGRRADVADTARFGEDGLPVEANWSVLPDDHPLRYVVCHHD